MKRRRRFVPTVSGFLAYWKQLSTVRRTYVGILLGLALQLLITVFLFFGSHIFHKAYGLWGEYGNTARCRRGVEWIPSVFWQFLWSAIFGPYILFRTLHIHDTHYWALQTKLAILAWYVPPHSCRWSSANRLSCCSLPGTPLWLAFLYTTTPAVARVNKYFVPAGWFLPGLAAIQVVSIVIPLYDAKKARKLVRRASSICSVSTTASGAGGLKGGKPRDMYSMASLEIQINKNIEPLLRWSAQKEFTAENIVFLKSVRDFKKRWELAFKRAQLSPLQLREQYEEAALIYFTLVSPTTAQFNINIEYRVLSELDELFSGLVYEPYLSDDRKRRSLPASGGVMPSGQDGALAPPALARGDSVVTPWMDIIRPIDTAASSISHEKLVDDDIERLYPTVVTEIEMSSPSGGIPKRFTVNCFDKAFDSVRYLVFTNTWVKFVDAGETVSLAESDMSNDYASKSGFDAY